MIRVTVVVNVRWPQDCNTDCNTEADSHSSGQTDKVHESRQGGLTAKALSHGGAETWLISTMRYEFALNMEATDVYVMHGDQRECMLHGKSQYRLRGLLL
jgi:hypothetical protein